MCSHYFFSPKFLCTGTAKFLPCKQGLVNVFLGLTAALLKHFFGGLFPCLFYNLHLIVFTFITEVQNVDRGKANFGKRISNIKMSTCFVCLLFLSKIRSGRIMNDRKVQNIPHPKKERKSDTWNLACTQKWVASIGLYHGIGQLL